MASISSAVSFDALTIAAPTATPAAHLPAVWIPLLSFFPKPSASSDVFCMDFSASAVSTMTEPISLNISIG